MSNSWSAEYLSDAFVLLKFECHKLQRDLAVTEESALKPLSRRKGRMRAIICSSESRRPRDAHHLPTNEFVKTDWFYWLLGWWRGGLLNVNVRQRGWIRRGAALSEKETLVALTARRERERCAERNGGKQTRAELTACNQFQCEAESMLGATVTRGQYSVNTNKTQVRQHTQHTNLSVKANPSVNCPSVSDGEATGAVG